MEESRMTFGAYLKAYFKQCLEVLKQPKMLLPTAILAVVWIGLGILQNKVGKILPLSILNFLTYAQGGLYGGIFGAIGGILGKIVVAAFVTVMIVPLFYKQNPFANFKQGFNEMVANVKFQGNDAISSLLKGEGIALLIYGIFNVTQSFENSMVGIVSAVALISAVARKGGFLWGLVLSFLNSVSKKKVPTYQQLVRLLTGMTLGFSLGVVLCVFGSNWASSIGLIALIVGWILGKKNSKKTVATTVLILLFLFPKSELFANSTGVWKLVDVKTETNPKALAATISGTTNSWRIDYRFEDVVGQMSGSMPPFHGSYAPGYNYLGRLEQRDEHRPSDKLIWPVSRHLRIKLKIYYGKDCDNGNTVVKERSFRDGDFSCTFPTLEEAGSEYLIIEESVELLEAYTRTLYYFKWDARGKAGNNSGSTNKGWGNTKITLPRWIDKFFGTDGNHTPDGITILIGILGALGGLGGGLGGTLGGGIGGGIPTGNTPGGNGPKPKNEPTPEELEWERYQKEMKERFNKYVHDNPDGTKTYIDPATGEKHTLYPKYNTETGAFSHWENENDSPYDEDKLNDWLAWRERNNETFAQDAAQAKQNLEEQRGMNQAINDYDRERGSSAMADKWKADKEQMEKEFEHEMRLRDYAWKKGLTDTDKETLTKALLKDRHEALEDGAQAMKDAAYWNDAVNYAETTEHIADATVSVMGEFPGNRGVKNFYTVLKSVAKHGMTGAVKGQGWGEVVKELGVGAAEGGLGVLQNQEMEGVFGTSLLGKIAKAGVNVGAESLKSVINDVMDPNKSASEILDNATNASVNRILYEVIGETTKAAGGLASDATASGAGELGSFSQEMGFHNSAAETIGHELNVFRRKIFGA